MPLGDVAAWEREIRDWLLGRLGKGLTTGESPAAEATLSGRALAWWIFEGKRHRFLDGPLALRSAEAEREVRRLDAVLSPEWSVEESPAAETDWVRTALRRPMDPVPRFVVRASSSGLTDLEREALHGWRRYTAGLWRDYGISMLKEQAIFSIFRHSAERPLYRIEKHPRLAARQGQYMVIAMDGRILRRGNDLAHVMRVLERALIRSV